MTPDEIRAHALKTAVHALAAEKLDSFLDEGEVIRLARLFTSYIDGSLPLTYSPLELQILPRTEVHPGPSAPASEDTSAGAWGPECTRCAHSAGVHLYTGCTHEECGCPRNEGEVRTIRVRCIRCTHDVEEHDGTGCTQDRCECTRTRTSWDAPEVRCTCTHQTDWHRVASDADLSGCIGCTCMWTGAHP